MSRALRPWLTAALLLASLCVGTWQAQAQQLGRAPRTELRCIPLARARPAPPSGCDVDTGGGDGPAPASCPATVCMQIPGGHGRPYTTSVPLNAAATRRHRPPGQCCYSAPVPAGSPMG